MQLQMSCMSTLLLIWIYTGNEIIIIWEIKDFLAANLKQIILFCLILIVKNVILPLQQGQGI